MAKVFDPLNVWSPFGAASQAVIEGGGKAVNLIVSLQQFTTDFQAFVKHGAVRSYYFEAPFHVATTLEISPLYDPRFRLKTTGLVENPLVRFVIPKRAKTCTTKIKAGTSCAA